MAKYTINHTCGHESTEQLVGPHVQRERKIEWLSGQICAECLQIERAKVSAHMADHDMALGYPQLEGSERQVTWASQLRHEAIVAAAKMEAQFKEIVITEGKGAALAEQLLFEIDGITDDWKAQKYAHWWIEHKDEASETGLSSRLRSISHELSDAMGMAVSEFSILSLSDQRDVIRMALKRREQILEEKRIEAARLREAEQAEIQRKRNAEVAGEQAKRDAIWQKKDAIAQAIAAAVGPEHLPAFLNVWMPASEKRVYLDGNGYKCCLYVSGGRKRPGTIECGKGLDPNKLKPALELVAKEWSRLKFQITKEGRAQ